MTDNSINLSEVRTASNGERICELLAMSLNVALLRSSFELVVSREPEMTSLFYQTLFSRYPEARRVFSRNAAPTQERMLQEALVAVMDHLDDASWLARTLAAVGAKHKSYGVTDEMYVWVGDSLLATLREVAGADWTPELADVWSEAYRAIASLMLQSESLSA